MRYCSSIYSVSDAAFGDFHQPRWSNQLDRECPRPPGLLVPSLPGHTLYLITLGGSQGVSQQRAIVDIMSMVPWLVVALSVTPGNREHIHLLTLLPESSESWLSRTKDCVFKNYRRLPQLVYSGDGTLEPCRVTFSKVFNLEGCLDYLQGLQNRATFVTILDTSPRRHTPDPGSQYNINNLQRPTSRLLDGQGVEVWERDEPQLLELHGRNVAPPRLDGEKEISFKWQPPRKLLTRTERPFQHKGITIKESMPVYAPHVSGYI